MDREGLIAALSFAFRRISAESVLRSQAIASRLRIGGADLECLDFLVVRGPLSAGELAEASGLTTGAITGVIDRLERAGFARRERDAADRRKVLVHLQPDAADRIAPLFEPMERAVSAVLDSYTSEDLAWLLDFLKRISAGSEAAIKELNAKAQP
jgi:DNA-binding MarR family transcriptional regulator